MIAAARWLGVRRIDLIECGSTNDEAARFARAGASHGTIVVAESQTAGRGRNGRSWVSPTGVGLYMSAIVRPPFLADLALALVPPMTLAIGIGLCDAVRACGVAAVLKWPNDVLVGSKKLAGVLVESQSHGSRLEAVIIGIGVNLSGELPAELAATAITLEQAEEDCAAGVDHAVVAAIDPGLPGKPSGSPARFASLVCAHVESWIDRYVAIGLPGIIPAWHDRMAPGLAASATVDGIALVGELAGLDGDGALLLRDAAGRLHRIRSGDVEVIRPTVEAEAGVTSC